MDNQLIYSFPPAIFAQHREALKGYIFWREENDRILVKQVWPSKEKAALLKKINHR